MCLREERKKGRKSGSKSGKKERKSGSKRGKKERKSGSKRGKKERKKDSKIKHIILYWLLCHTVCVEISGHFFQALYYINIQCNALTMLLYIAYT